MAMVSFASAESTDGGTKANRNQSFSDTWHRHRELFDMHYTKNMP